MQEEAAKAKAKRRKKIHICLEVFEGGWILILKKQKPVDDINRVEITNSLH